MEGTRNIITGGECGAPADAQRLSRDWHGTISGRRVLLRQPDPEDRMAAPITVTDETLPLAIDLQPLVVVDFWAPWCGPCRMLGPVIDRLADRYEGRVMFAKLNVDENPGASMHYRVQSIPALLFFQNGKLVDRTVGALPESLLATKLDQLLSAPARVPVRVPAKAASPSPQAA